MSLLTPLQLSFVRWAGVSFLVAISGVLLALLAGAPGIGRVAIIVATCIAAISIPLHIIRFIREMVAMRRGRRGRGDRR